MAEPLVKQLIDAGIHFGHRASRWNPKMKPYIFGKRNLIHIIDVKETLKGILLAKKFLSQVVSGGKDVLLVGTKRQARKAVEEHATAIHMHCVTDRWLGGTLTNFREIRKRVGRLDQLEQLEADGMLDTYSKKEGASLRREIRKIHRNLGGIRKMDRLPGAVVVIDQRREINAVREAQEDGHPRHLPDRHGQRPGPGGHSHPRQRRRDAGDRAGRGGVVRKHLRRVGHASKGWRGGRAAGWTPPPQPPGDRAGGRSDGRRGRPGTTGRRRDKPGRGGARLTAACAAGRCASSLAVKELALRAEGSSSTYANRIGSGYGRDIR